MSYIFALVYNLSVPLEMINILIMFTMLCYPARIIINLSNISYLLRKDITVIPGKIIKVYSDSPRRYHASSSSSTYKIKFIELFSGRIINNRRFSGRLYRAKAQSLDGKCTSPWVPIGRTIARKKENYSIKIVMYKNEAITFLYEKKND